MFDKYIICEDGFENVTENSKTIGFKLQVRLPYYRGLGISMIQDLKIKLDDKDVDRNDIRVTIHGNTYTMDEMEVEYEDRWEFGEKGTITILKDGGLPPGKHKLEVTPLLRISYLPFISETYDCKELSI